MNHDREKLLKRLRDVMARHHGRGACISMTALVPAVMGGFIIPMRRYDQTRIVRSLVAALQEEGMPIVHKGGRGGGYYVAATDEELNAEADWFHKRALSSLHREAVLRRTSVRQVVQQIELELESAE